MAWPAYRAVAEGLATWTEVTTSMTIDDLDLVFMARSVLEDAQRSDSDESDTDQPRRMHKERAR